MHTSVSLGRLAGIPVGLHWSIVLIAGLFTASFAGTILPAAAPGYAAGLYLVLAAVAAVVFLASIVAHELGHSIIARNNGVGVSGITLFALGGVAKLEREPDSPGAAARIALAGPAVSVALGVSTLVVATLSWLGLINLAMAVFNMIPALPLDGGRALQAALWKRTGDRPSATVKASAIGRYVGIGLIVLGLLQFLSGGGGLWTALIGWFIMSAARAEGRRAQFEIDRRSWPSPTWSPWVQASSPPPPRPADVVYDVEGNRVH